MKSNTLSVEEAMALLKKQSEKARRLLRGPRSSVTWIQALSWRNTTYEIISHVFGENSRNTGLFTQAKAFIPKNSSYPGYFFLEGLNSLLEGFIEQLEMGIIPKKGCEEDKNNRILVVGGHNSDMRDEICSFIRSLNLEPVIMDTKSGEDKTGIDAFEEHSGRCSFALILLTGESLAAGMNGNHTLSNYGTLKESEIARLQAKKELYELEKRRERENEFFELGYFIGKMGRQNVRVLSEEIFKRPPDVDGVLFVPLDERWRERLNRELLDSGIDAGIELQ